MGVGGPLGKVTPGQPLRVPATAYNAFVDAAEAHRRSLVTGGPGSGAASQFDTAWVRNDSGHDRGRFEVLAVGSSPILPSVNLREFQRWPVLGGVTPTLADAGRALVLLEPIRNGRVGRALLAGVTACRVRMIDDRDRCADVDEQSAETLRSCQDGPAQLLWVQPRQDRQVPSIAWVIAKLGLAAVRSMRVIITGSEDLSANRWRYRWAEARWGGTQWLPAAGGYTHTQWGYAYSGLENGNRSTGVQGTGIDVANLNGSFAHKPVGPGASMQLFGPHYDAGGVPAWVFDPGGSVDGACP